MIKKKGQGWLWVGVLGLAFIVGFLVFRSWHLTAIPIFADEAIYIRWAQVMRAEPTLRFLPLSDGKQPLFMWSIIPFLKFFQDPLMAGRVVSILAGLGSLLGLFSLSFYLTRSRVVGFFVAALYIVVPYTFFFDRMALVDSLLFALGIWIFLFGLLLKKLMRIDLAIVTGIVLGGALITKSPALFFAALMPTTILLLPWEKNRKKLAFPIIKLIGLWLIVYGFAFAVYSILRLGPNFHMIAARNQDYIFPISEVLSHPHDPLLVHLKDIFVWFPNLFTWPILATFLFGAIAGFWQKEKRAMTLILLLWFLVPLLAQSSVARVFTPRYLLFTTFPLFVLTGFSFEYLLKRKKGLLVSLLVLLGLVILPLRYDFLLATNPQKAPLPEKMRSGYLEEWTSGYGIWEVRDYLRQASKEGHLNVGTEGAFGTLPDGLQIYFDKDPKVTVFGIGLSLLEVPEPLVESAGAGESATFLVVNQSRMGAQDDPQLELLLKIPKAIGKKGQDNLLFYQVK